VPYNALPHLTADLPGVGGRYKMRPEDFQVTEVPLYAPCGTGPHVYFTVTKKGVATMAAAAAIARALGRGVNEVGYAGLKDARAITTQWMSVEHVEPRRLEELQLANIRIGEVARHTNKLRTGHLAANRFALKIRQTIPDPLPAAEAVLDVLTRRGAPNYFGAQRFGLRGDGWRMGRCLLEKRFGDFLDVFIGRPVPGEPAGVLAARRAYDEGRLDDAHKHWPSGRRDERRALAVLRHGRGPAAAARTIGKKLHRLLLSAYQSHLFNRVVAGRLDRIDRILDGDLAYRHDHGAVFRVTDPAAEQPRADAFEISPTGPIFGYRMTQPTGEPGELEQAVLDEAGLTLESFRERGRLRLKGGRRALRFHPRDVELDVGTDEWGGFLKIWFTLASGCYATVVLEEIMKRPQPAPPEPDDTD
jgi:tRNA pseudouridine13 synthase